MQASPGLGPTVRCARQRLRYSIRVTQLGGVYDLHTPELLLTVRTKDLRDGYERLLKRQQEVVDLAHSMGMSSELPPPAGPPALKSVFTLATEVDSHVVPVKPV